jgi:hypothetical protein
MTRLLIPAFLMTGLAAAAGGCASDNTTTPSASLRVTNHSDFKIVELRVTTVNSATWGPNLVESDPLFPGDDITLDVSCGFYDVLLVDEANVDCELHDLDLCLNDADFVITNSTCSVFNARQQPASGSSINKTDAGA